MTASLKTCAFCWCFVCESRVGAYDHGDPVCVDCAKRERKEDPGFPRYPDSSESRTKGGVKYMPGLLGQQGFEMLTCPHCYRNDSYSVIPGRKVCSGCDCEFLPSAVRS